MHKFTDADGREWTLELDLLMIRSIEASDYSRVYSKPVVILGPNGMNADLILDGMTNTGLLAAMAWTMVQEQAKERNLDENDFCGAIKQEQLTAMKEAVWNEFLDFFQESRIPLLKSLEHIKAAQRQLEERLSDPNGALSRRMTSLVDGLLTQAEKDLPKALMREAGLGSGSGTPVESPEPIGEPEG